MWLLCNGLDANHSHEEFEESMGKGVLPYMLYQQSFITLLII